VKPWLRFCTQGARFCGQCVLSFACWTLWLVLGLLLAAQIGIAVSHELAVPRFLLRAFEERLAASHVSATFGRATFDPSGSVIVEDLRIALPGLGEPVVRVRATFVELDPWALLTGRFEPRRISATGISLAVPAMLSHSGRTEEILSDLELTCVPGEKEVAIEHLTARVAGIALTMHGAIHFVKKTGAGAAPLPLAEYLAKNYPDICRKLVRITAQLAALETPTLQAELVPSETRGATATITIRTPVLKLTSPRAIEAKGVTATTRLPLLGDAPTMAPLQLACDGLEVSGVSARRVLALVRGSFKPSDLSFRPGTVELEAERCSSRGFAVDFPAARLDLAGLPRTGSELIALLAGQPVSLSGYADASAGTAALHFSGALAPALLMPISAAIGHDVRRFIGFGAPLALDADIAFAAGWKFHRLAGHLIARRVDAYHVPIDFARGDIEFDGRHFIARHAKAMLGDNFATGSFEQDLQTREFRFLLEGRLRPLAISGWFHDWWRNFFDDFAFPAAAPDASVDVAGWWGAGYQTTVFVFADSVAPEIRGARFDHARTLLFIRPNFYDGLEIFATHGAGEIRGTFARTVNTATGAWQSLDFDVVSSIDPAVSVQIFGPAAAERLAPFRFESPPLLKLAGHFDGPAAPGGEHQRVKIEAQSTGAFALHDFPLRDLSFTATQHDDEVTLSGIEAHFAEGTVRGKARIWGRGAARRIGFDGSLHDASLAQAVAVLEQYTAKRQGLPAPPPGKFLQGKASVKLDLAASAEGRYDDMLSFKGGGNAVLAGPGLGEVQLLGALSELLNFTSLRFTAARANFKLDGAKLVFPDVSITGANSAIQAHGDYSLDRHSLAFNARVYPFQESKFFLQSVVGAVLSPLSTVLEVKLTGSLDKPSWSFVIGPTNFLRNLIQRPPPPTEQKPDPNPAPPPYISRPPEAKKR
jgi:hypothetical protein